MPFFSAQRCFFPYLPPLQRLEMAMALVFCSPPFPSLYSPPARRTKRAGVLVVLVSVSLSP
jgi:hypothetical protein